MRRVSQKSEMVTRGEAGRILGVTKTTIRRYEASRLLVPRLEGGAHVFARRSVELLAARRRRSARAKEVREVVLNERDLGRVSFALGLDARAASPAEIVAAVERLRALVRELRAAAATAAPR